MSQIVLAILLAFMLAGLGGCFSGGSKGSDGDENGNIAASLPLTLEFTRIASGVANPTVIAHAGDGSGRLFIVQQGGQVLILSNGTLLPVPFLDIADRLSAGGERGLLGLAFPPDYAQKGYFYVYYTRAPDGASVLSRFHRSASDPNCADPASEAVLLSVPQPFSNHNGGQLAFGPFDGYLYLGLGDGGSGGDPLGHGQNPDTLLGALLRLDVEAGGPGYAIPADNPFRADPTRADEIWAYGLRNPWRFSFDRLNGDLYIADVGQASWEEINFQAGITDGGANYGWNRFEGPACFEPPVGCTAPADYVAPVAFYDHSLGSSVTGGYVYRGPDNPAMQGLYFYGDFGSGRIWALRRQGNDFTHELLAQTMFAISTFGEDEAGRLYLADYSVGDIYRIDQQ